MRTWRTPRSINLRARRQFRPRAWRPYRSRTTAGSSDKSNASASRGNVGRLAATGGDGGGKPRLVFGAQGTGRLAVQTAGAGVANRPRQQDCRRHSVLPSQQAGNHGTDVRRLVEHAEIASGHLQALARLVQRRPGMVQAAKQRVAIGEPGHLRKVLADLDAWNVGRDRTERPANLRRRVRFQVPGIELAGGAYQKQRYARASRARPQRRPRGRGQDDRGACLDELAA